MDWDDHLDLAEFAINDSIQSSTGYSPFYMAYGQNPVSAIDLTRTTVVPAATDFATTMHEMVEHAKVRLREASLRQATYANQTRQDMVFRVGDQVKLSTVNLALPSTMSSKLKCKYVGPCTVDQVINPVAYKLKLPAVLSRIHPVFHISLLQPWKTDMESLLTHQHLLHPQCFKVMTSITWTCYWTNV